MLNDYVMRGDLDWPPIYFPRCYPRYLQKTNLSANGLIGISKSYLLVNRKNGESVYHRAWYAQTTRRIWTCWCAKRPQSHKQSLGFRHQKQVNERSWIQTSEIQCWYLPLQEERHCCHHSYSLHRQCSLLWTRHQNHQGDQSCFYEALGMQRLRSCKGVPPHEHLTRRQQDHNWSMHLSWKNPAKVWSRQCLSGSYPSPSGLSPNGSWRCRGPQSQITLPTSDQIPALSYAWDSSWYSICSDRPLEACRQALKRTSWSRILYMYATIYLGHDTTPLYSMDLQRQAWSLILILIGHQIQTPDTHKQAGLSN